MTAEEIALTDEPFSKTVVEWNWNDRKTDLIPEIGEGEINKYGATQGAAADFNNVVCSGKGGASSEQKGLVANGGITFSNGGISTPTRANTSTFRSPRRESAVRTWSSASSGATAQ